MAIYTTYFANLRNLPRDIIPISICGKAPTTYRGLQYKKLAPKYDFFVRWKETGDNEYYIKCFNDRVLGKLNPTDVISDLKALSAGRDIALVCYEKPGNFCHRFLVSDWLNKNGFYCKEF